MIADAHRIFAGALESLLRRSGHDVVGCVAGFGAAVNAVLREQADACVLDADLAGIGEPGRLQEAIAGSPRTAFVVLADSPGSPGFAGTLAAGVHGAALKTDDFVEVLRVLTGAAVRLARRAPGGAVLSLSAQAAHRPVRHSTRYPALDHLLTPREREVLARLVHGESTTSMARSMGVQLSTTRTHIDSVLIKLGVHSRLEAVAYAVRKGIIDVPGRLELEGAPDALSG
ncbi:MAG: response regulator transcription factor [Streptosporangiaceae bacterium]|nr:response regulator transcription factor [Streptosporangiaceae bacterium]